MDPSHGSLWSYLWEGTQDVPTLVTSECKRKDKEGLRGAIRAARTAANASVSRVKITSAEDLRELPQLRLQERFPNLASVALTGYHQGPIAINLAAFASQTLAKLRKLTTVDLSYCQDLDAASACAALVPCSQLQDLSLPEGALMSQAALVALAQLTGLTRLKLTRATNMDLQAMRQISSLQQLQHLDLECSQHITDQAVACLTQLKALTAVSLKGCWPLQGSTLGQLAALSGLLSLDLRFPGLTTLKSLELLPALQALCLLETEHAALAPLSALTSLTRLELPHSQMTDEFSAVLPLASLASLASLTIGRISLTDPPAAGVLPHLTYLQVYGFGSLASLLPLLQLEVLHVPHTVEHRDADASLVAAISQQTRPRSLELKGVSDQHMAQVVAPLKQLQSFKASFAIGETSCLAACAALAELPLLRKLTLQVVPQLKHLALLVRCRALEDVYVMWREGGNKPWGGASTGLLAALVCKPGMRKLSYPRDHAGASCDKQLLAQVAARAGVELVVY